MSRLPKDNAFPKTATACQSSGRFHFHGAQPSSVVRRISIIGFVFLAGERLPSWLVLSRRAPFRFEGASRRIYSEPP